jgi:hypothetical protein
MAHQWKIVVLLLACNLLASALFNGQSYTGSAEQHAELDQITAQVQARRVRDKEKYLAELRKPIDVTPSLQKNTNVSAQQIADAGRIVDRACKKWHDSYRPYIANPRRNVYPKNQNSTRRAKVRRSGQGAEFNRPRVVFQQTRHSFCPASIISLNCSCQTPDLFHHPLRIVAHRLSPQPTTLHRSHHVACHNAWLQISCRLRGAVLPLIMADRAGTVSREWKQVRHCLR